MLFITVSVRNKYYLSVDIPRDPFSYLDISGVNQLLYPSGECTLNSCYDRVGNDEMPAYFNPQTN